MDILVCHHIEWVAFWCFSLVFRRELQWTKWCHSYVDGLARGPRLERRRQAVQTQAAKVPNVVAGWVFLQRRTKDPGRTETENPFSIQHWACTRIRTNESLCSSSRLAGDCLINIIRDHHASQSDISHIGGRGGGGGGWRRQTNDVSISATRLDANAAWYNEFGMKLSCSMYRLSS